MRYRRRTRRAYGRARYRRHSTRRRSRLLLRGRRRIGRRKVRLWRRKGQYILRQTRFHNAIVPDVTYARLTYRKGGLLLIANNSLATNSGQTTPIYVNDPYDPDPDLANSSAQGFDYFRDYYNFWICTKSKIRVEFNNIGIAQNQNSPWGAVGYVLPQFGGSPNIVAQSPVNYVQNLPRIKWVSLSGPGAGKSKGVVRHEWTLVKDQGAQNRSNTWEYSAWSAAINGSPTNRRVLYLAAGTANGAGNVTELQQVIQYKVTIVYYTRFYARKPTAELEDPE